MIPDGEETGIVIDAVDRFLERWEAAGGKLALAIGYHPAFVDRCAKENRYFVDGKGIECLLIRQGE